MPRKLILLCAIVLCGVGSQTFAQRASATTPLTRAVIQLLRNDVDLIPEGQSARPAEISDRMIPGDALATERESFAELRFNDGSLARVGERVLFRFVPNTRTFRLNNGTMLLLIPPGQGRTRLQTPNATAGIRGSALFARYIEETDTTLIGALTDSGIEVYNEDETQRYEMEAGQVAVVVEDRIERIYKMDLIRFYETSELARGLNLGSTEYLANRGQIETSAEPESLTMVRAETLTALEEYEFDDSGVVLQTPNFMRMSANEEDLEDAGLTPNQDAQFPGDERASDRPSQQLDRVLDASEIQNEPPSNRPSLREPGSDRPDRGPQRPDRPEPPGPGPEPPNPPQTPGPNPEPPGPNPEPPGPQEPGPQEPTPGNEGPRPSEPDNERPGSGDDDRRDPRDPEEGGVDVEAGEG